MKGNQTWHCTSDGHEDSFSVNISGGFGKDISAENEDWLISELPFDLSAMQNPILSFWQKALYEGAVIRSVKVSTNYSGGDNPTADSAIWITLNIPGINQQPANQWEQINGIDLSTYKNAPFIWLYIQLRDRRGIQNYFMTIFKIEDLTGITDGSKISASIQI